MTKIIKIYLPAKEQQQQQLLLSKERRQSAVALRKAATHNNKTLESVRERESAAKRYVARSSLTDCKTLRRVLSNFSTLFKFKQGPQQKEQQSHINALLKMAQIQINHTHTH